MFDIGDKVVYPHHGAGTVVSKEKRLVLGAGARVPDDQDPAQRHDRERPERERREGRSPLGDRRADGRGGRQDPDRCLDRDAEELEPPLQAQPRQDEDRRHPRAGRGRAEPRAAGSRQGPLDGREADVREGEEDPRLRAHVREGDDRGAGSRVARRGRRAPGRQAAAKSKPKAAAATSKACALSLRESARGPSRCI